MSQDAHVSWPRLTREGWGRTQPTLHRYLQVVGKIRMSLVPPRQNWWHTTLRLATRGLTTGPMPHGDRQVEIALDLLDHRLTVHTSDGQERCFDLGIRPACADFYRDLMAALEDLGVHVEIRPFPYDLGPGPSFADDTVHASYDAGAVTAYWEALAGTGDVLEEFASRFTGEASPVHLFWHRLDLAHTRHSHRGGVVAAGHPDPQVVGFGFGVGDERALPYPAFYCFVDPEPAGLVEHPLDLVGAEWRSVYSSHRAVLPYDVVRASPDPRQTLLDFYETAYVVAAGTAGWDVAAHSARGPRGTTTYGTD
jgi:hypothetical protein